MKYMTTLTSFQAFPTTNLSPRRRSSWNIYGTSKLFFTRVAVVPDATRSVDNAVVVIGNNISFAQACNQSSCFSPMFGAVGRNAASLTSFPRPNPYAFGLVDVDYQAYQSWIGRVGHVGVSPSGQVYHLLMISDTLHVYSIATGSDAVLSCPSPTNSCPSSGNNPTRIFYRNGDNAHGFATHIAFNGDSTILIFFSSSGDWDQTIRVNGAQDAFAMITTNGGTSWSNPFYPYPIDGSSGHDFPIGAVFCQGGWHFIRTERTGTGDFCDSATVELIHTWNGPNGDSVATASYTDYVIELATASVTCKNFLTSKPLCHAANQVFFLGSDASSASFSHPYFSANASTLYLYSRDTSGDWSKLLIVSAPAGGSIGDALELALLGNSTYIAVFRMTTSSGVFRWHWSYASVSNLNSWAAPRRLTQLDSLLYNDNGALNSLSCGAQTCVLAFGRNQIDADEDSFLAEFKPCGDSVVDPFLGEECEPAQIGCTSLCKCAPGYGALSGGVGGCSVPPTAPPLAAPTAPPLAAPTSSPFSAPIAAPSSLSVPMTSPMESEIPVAIPSNPPVAPSSTPASGQVPVASTPSTANFVTFAGLEMRFNLLAEGLPSSAAVSSISDQLVQLVGRTGITSGFSIVSKRAVTILAVITFPDQTSVNRVQANATLQAQIVDAVTKALNPVAPASAPSQSNLNGGGGGLGVGAIIGIVIGVLAAIAIVVVAVVLVQRRKNRKGDRSASAPQNTKPSTETKRPKKVPKAESSSEEGAGNYGTLDVEEQAQNGGELQTFRKEWIISYDDLEFGKQIGRGAFGVVFRGEYGGSDVAIKQCALNIAADSIQEFKNEAVFMLNLKRHPNIVSVLGICQNSDDIFVVMEFCDGGSLDKYITKPNITIDEKVHILAAAARGSYSAQVHPIPVWILTSLSSGILHLHKSNVVHRDIAARNVLLVESNKGSIAKMADFGMSRVVEEFQDTGTTQSNMGPVKTMAPECIKHKKYSFASDVWAFGLLCVEVISGETVHRSLDLLQAALRIRDEGYTPKIPDQMPKWLAKLCKRCWSMKPSLRPTMHEIVQLFRENAGGARLDESGPAESSAVGTSAASVPSSSSHGIQLRPQEGIPIDVDEKGKDKAGSGKSKKKQESESESESEEEPEEEEPEEEDDDDEDEQEKEDEESTSEAASSD
jgi:serine/threonine protein kinase